MNLNLSAPDWLSLWFHFSTLSLLSVGGGMSVVPGMHRFLVDEHAWLTDAQFSTSIALGQIAPGPNVLFVSLMGWSVGLNAGGMQWALLGAVLCLLGMVLPSSLLTLFATRWAHRNQHHLGIRAFKLGMAPLVVALLVSTAWLLITPNVKAEASWWYWLAGALALAVLWKTKLHLLWVLLAGAVAGALGWI
ncbi:MAG: chromate transporter [Ideonella sp.]